MRSCYFRIKKQGGVFFRRETKKRNIFGPSGPALLCHRGVSTRLASIQGFLMPLNNRDFRRKVQMIFCRIRRSCDSTFRIQNSILKIQDKKMCRSSKLHWERRGLKGVWVHVRRFRNPPIPEASLWNRRRTLNLERQFIQYQRRVDMQFRECEPFPARVFE